MVEKYKPKAIIIGLSMIGFLIWDICGGLVGGMFGAILSDLIWE